MIRIQKQLKTLAPKTYYLTFATAMETASIVPGNSQNPLLTVMETISLTKGPSPLAIPMVTEHQTLLPTTIPHSTIRSQTTTVFQVTTTTAVVRTEYKVPLRTQTTQTPMETAYQMASRIATTRCGLTGNSLKQEFITVGWMVTELPISLRKQSSLPINLAKRQNG